MLKGVDNGVHDTPRMELSDGERVLESQFPRGKEVPDLGWVPGPVNEEDPPHADHRPGLLNPAGALLGGPG